LHEPENRGIIAINMIEVPSSAEEQEFDELIGEFLSLYESPQTRRSYERGISNWKSWCAANNVRPRCATPEDAHRWADHLAGAWNSKKRDISAVSSFYTWLSHKKNWIASSPFYEMPRGVDAPQSRPMPTLREINKILKALEQPSPVFDGSTPLGPAIIAMAYCGFRIGALQGLTIAGSKFATTSKRKAWEGELTPKVTNALKPLGTHPFENAKQGTIAAAFKSVTKRLAKSGDIRHKYSVNDLRRFFADREFRKDYDLWRVSRRLNLSSVKETSRFLGLPNHSSDRRNGDPNQLITSFQGFIERIGQIREKAADRYGVFFRGHENESYELVPSLYRQQEGDYIEFEHTMFAEMIVQHPGDFSADTTTLEKLVRMQHFSMPTRLLDFTGNPLVALFFACQKEAVTGEVVYLTVPNDKIEYYDSDTVSVIANLAKVPYAEKDFDLQQNLEKLVSFIKEEKPHFSGIVGAGDINVVLCVKVKKNNPRIVVQDGLFLAFGIGSSPDKCATIDQDWMPSVMDGRKKILIASDSKRKILDDLSLISISERTLFPDLETTAKSITSRYQ
jgi:hypothetical protein